MNFILSLPIIQSAGVLIAGPARAHMLAVPCLATLILVVLLLRGVRIRPRRCRRPGRPAIIQLGVTVLLAVSLAPAAQAQEIEWIRQFGGPDLIGVNGLNEALGIAADTAGVYVVGQTDSTLPGQISAGEFDAFVRKYDPKGNEVWTRQFGSSTWDEARAVSVDASGVYVAGTTLGRLSGPTSAFEYDVYVRKYDHDGNEVWTRQFGSLAWGISLDASGVYVTGQTGGGDAFVRKYDHDGNEVWTRQFGSLEEDLASGISADASGVYVAGYTYGTLPGQTSAGGVFDAFVCKYDRYGNEVWTRQFGTSDYDYAGAVSVDASGVYVAGYTYGTLPGQTSAGGQDAFVRKYDHDGNQVWTRQFGTSSSDDARGVSVDASGVYVTGITTGTLPGQTSAGGWDAFVRKYDHEGNEVWTRQFGSPMTQAIYGGIDWATGISVGASGVYVAGFTGGTLPGQVWVGGLVDAFVAKLSLPTPPELLEQLIANVVSLKLQQGISKSLNAKLQVAVKALENVNPNSAVAINVLQAFIHEVQAQRGVHISSTKADALIAAAQQIISSLGD